MTKKGTLLSQKAKDNMKASWTPERRKEASKKLKGVPRPQETVDKIKAAWTDEKRKEVSVASSGRHHTEENKKRIGEASKGRIFTEETRRKIGKVRKGCHHTEEAKRKMSKAHKGKYHSEETKRKMSKAHGKGSNNLWYGKHHSEEAKKRMRETHLGENSPNWQGGISKEPYAFEFNDDLKELIRKRDHYTCQLCNIGQNGIRHPIHHIDYDKMNCAQSNLITLCIGCNAKANFNRDFHCQYFTNLILQQKTEVELIGV